MSIFFYIIGYIVLSIAIAYFLKSRKIKAKKINNYSKAKEAENKIFNRRKHNDYMNNPKFSYMSCNKYNPESPFYKGKKVNTSVEIEKRYVLIEESKYNKILDSVNSSYYSVNSSDADCAGSLGGSFNPNSTLLSRHWN